MPTGAHLQDIEVDRSDDHVYTQRTTYINEFDSSGALIVKFATPEGEYLGLSNAQGVAVNETTHIVYGANNRTTGIHDPGVDRFVRTGEITIPDVTTGSASVTPTTASLTGEVDPDLANAGTPINLCNFEWGTNPANLSNDIPCDQALPINSPTAVTAEINEGLSLGTTYYYKLTAANEGNEVLSVGGIQEFEPAGPPEISEEAVSEVNTDGARISANVSPGGGDTTYRIEYGETEGYGNNVPEPDGELQDNLVAEDISHALSGLTAGTVYHYRIWANNPNGTTLGEDHAFTTFPSEPGGIDPCPNAQVRQQTGAAKLLDCRAYELASAANTVVTTCSPTSSRAWKRWDHSRAPLTGFSTRFTSAKSPARASPPTTGSTRTWRRVAPAAGTPPTWAFRQAARRRRCRSARPWRGRAAASGRLLSVEGFSAIPASRMARPASPSAWPTAASCRG